MRARTAVLLSFLIVETDCAAVNPRAGLDDIKRLVSPRGALAVSWPADREAATTVENTVDALLGTELTLESAVRIALLNNRNLQAVYQELGIAEAELVQAGLLPNPVLSANVRFGLGPSGVGTEAGLVQDVISALQIPLRKRVAEARLEEAKLAVADTILNLALDTKVAFYRLQGAHQLLELRRTVAAATAVAREIAERQHAVGNISDLDLSTEQALNEEAKIELASAELDVRAGREAMNALLGLWGERTVWTMSTRLPEPPVVDVPGAGLETLAVSQRLDLEVARVRTVGALQQYRLARFYGLVPSASLGTVTEREVDGGWSVGPALGIPIPLFDQSQAILAADAARIRGSEERYAALAVEIRSQVRRAWMRLEATRTRTLYYSKILLPLRHDVVEHTQRQYNAMQVGVFQLLQAKRDEIETGRAYIASLTDYWTGRSELERAVGGELRIGGDALQPATLPLQSIETPAGHHHHHHGG